MICGKSVRLYNVILTNGALKNSTNMLVFAGIPKMVVKNIKTHAAEYTKGETLGLTSNGSLNLYSVELFILANHLRLTSFELLSLIFIVIHM